MNKMCITTLVGLVLLAAIIGVIVVINAGEHSMGGDNNGSNKTKGNITCAVWGSNRMATSVSDCEAQGGIALVDLELTM
ncbi:hypothetical protein GZH46_02917 [Fragariocoptes setiger]|uniref:Uncharacterized protein n=1 Tax=Fragariocoptes setiger TaxID=1670756 RepID=A0ABQ7S599_9ACAR|nr:hypothetical protein GZH46_02917 [Fragariocoptes setiger]